MPVRDLLKSAAGVPTGPANYVEDVFSAYLYTGNGNAQYIDNGVDFETTPTDNVVAQLSGDSFTDVSPIPITFDTFGGPSINTSIVKYGSGSMFFDGSGDYLQYRRNGNLALGTGDFTVECWVYFTNGISHTFQRIFWFEADGVVNRGLAPELYSNDTTRLTLNVGNGTQIIGDLTTAPPRNTWVHLAAVRSNGITSFYVNGVSQGQISDSTNYTVVNSGPLVGTAYEGSSIRTQTLNGYIDDFRVTKGVARYTANFTPPNAALPVVTGFTGNDALIWIKDRGNGGWWHNLFPITSNFYGTRRHYSNTTSPLATGTFLTPNFSGFSVNVEDGNINGNNQNYASWTFRKQPKFFDVVTYTGNGVGGRAIAHNLGGTPGMVIVKRTNSSSDWVVWHRSAGTNNLILNAASAAGATYVDRVAADSTNIYLASTSEVNASGSTYVAYIFAHNAGGFGAAGTDNIISCGSFTTDGSGNATVNLDYEPQYFLVKCSSASDSWYILDVMRGFNQSSAALLQANSEGAEASVSAYDTPTATGVTIRGMNPSATFIYMAIRRPMKTPTTGTQVFSPVTYSGNGTTRNITSNFPVDLHILNNRGGADHYTFDRLRGNSLSLYTNSTGADVDFGSTVGPLLSNNTGITLQSLYFNSISENWVDWMFRRAPGFMDVVCYTGTGSARTVTHNLGVAPELIIVKRRDSAGGWRVYSSSFAANQFLGLETTNTVLNSTTIWNSTAPTSSVFTVGTSTLVNASGGTYVAYLFASVNGVSKLGTYTGNGSSQTINCGFSAGARFVLIKRTDSTGDWFVWDTARGIVSGNDPHLSLNTTAAEVTGNDNLDPANSGFIVVEEAGASINANGGTYLFLAIA